MIWVGEVAAGGYQALGFRAEFRSDAFAEFFGAR
jgi:hypothetical protein